MLGRSILITHCSSLRFTSGVTPANQLVAHMAVKPFSSTAGIKCLLLSTSSTVAVVTVLVVGSPGVDGYAYHNDNAGLTEVPDDIPSTVLTVYLSWNEISDVKLGAFSRLQWCRYITEQK